MPWLCAVLVVLVGLTRGLVLCTHEGGHTHLEFAHDEGACCVDPVAEALTLPQGDHDGDATRSDPTCSHVDLLVELSPEPRPQGCDLPEVPAFEPAWGERRFVAAPRATARRRPPATGPPRGPRAFLRRHATDLLLI